MKTRFLILALSGGLCVSSGAQYEPDTLKPLPLVCDVFLLPGGQFESTYAIGLDQWRTLAPGSELLKHDMSDHTVGGFYGFDRTSSGLLAVSVAFRLGGAVRVKRSGAYLRGGFAYGRRIGGDHSLRKETRVPYDTLVSSQTGASVLIDSVTTSTYSMSHEYEQVMIDVSLVFMKEYPKRWALYGGAGAAIGFAFGGVASVVHRTERYTDPRLIGSGTSGFSRAGTTEWEDLRTKDDLTFSVYTPLGVSYRLGKRRAFWRALNLCYEMRPALSMGGVPELDPGVRVAVGQYFGLRVDLAQ